MRLIDKTQEYMDVLSVFFFRIPTIARCNARLIIDIVKSVRVEVVDETYLLGFHKDFLAGCWSTPQTEHVQVSRPMIAPQAQRSRWR